jgi:hypothetical protein
MVWMAIPLSADRPSEERLQRRIMSGIEIGERVAQITVEVLSENKQTSEQREALR